MLSFNIILFLKMNENKKRKMPGTHRVILNKLLKETEQHLAVNEYLIFIQELAVKLNINY